MKKASFSKTEIHSGLMDPASIVEMSEKIAETLESLNVELKDIVKMRLSAESVMEIWARELGEDTACRLLMVQRFGKPTLFLQADGKQVDPTLYQDDLLLKVSSNPNIVVSLGLPAEYSYTGGVNELTLRLPAAKKNPVRNVIIALAAAVVLGLASRLLFPGPAAVVAAGLLTPLIDAITRVLRLIAGPIVFLSIVSGITGVGDAASFGRIGGTLVKSFMAKMTVFAILIWLSVIWMFPVSLSVAAGGEGIFEKLLRIVLDIIPGDVVSPFQTGNALQIIFIAICVGLGCIALNDSARDVVSLINQLNLLVQFLMGEISKMLPAFIFLSISNLIITSDISELTQILVPFLLISVLSVLLPVIHGFYTSVKMKIPFGKLLHSQLPTFLVALTTASSAAALSSNVECCEKELGIDEKLVRFGVPFGQVLFMPGAVIMFAILSLYMAKVNEVPITPAWLVTMIVVVPILAAATPPIPGGALSSILVLFGQLGIPSACIGIGAVIAVFCDYVTTAANIAGLQQELLINAKKLDLMKDNSNTEKM